MANIFAITTVNDKLKADAGSATIVFTVTNTTSRPLRGIAKIKPLGSTEAQWLKIDGETERDFPAGGTHQFTVIFNKPKPAAPPIGAQPAELFPFRLDEISAANPDEDFTEGPMVTIEIPEQKVEEKKPFPWWIIPVAAVLLIFAGVILWLVLRNGGAKVPEVTGLAYPEAEKTLTDAGFTAQKSEEIAPDKTLDVVFNQDPPAGAKADPAVAVKLSVPAATTVPNLVNLTLNAAITALEKKGLKIGDVVGDGDAIKNGTLNQISKHTPPFNEPVAKGTEVSVVFPCVDSPPFKLCRRISVNDLRQQATEISPALRKQLETSNPKFRLGP